jgi:transcriptional regulator NrdR family protein
MVLDPMAAARFASVFRGFGSADDYAEFFDAMEAPLSDSPSQDGESEGGS